MGETIQMAVAPVFLLVAIGSILNVVTSRLGRVVDRARNLEDRVASGSRDPDSDYYRTELKALERRMTFSHWAINFLSLSALVVAALVAVVFIADTGNEDHSTLISGLFITAVAGVMAGISCFILEIAIATRTVHVRSEFR